MRISDWSSDVCSSDLADDFFTGLFETALADDEIIVSVSFPKPAKAAYMKFDNPASRYALVGVFVAQAAGGVRVAVTGSGQDGVFRVPAMEKARSANRTEGRRVGKTCVGTCRSRWAPYSKKK